MADPKDPFNRITNPDGTPVRDKDNAHPVLKPVNQNLRPAQNLAPGGSMGIRQRKSSDLVPQRPSVEIINRIDTDTHRYIDGRITTMPDMRVMAMINDKPSPVGIEEGHVDQLVLMQMDKTVARYNRGWEIDPQTPQHKQAIQFFREEFDPSYEKQRSNDLVPKQQPEKERIKFTKSPERSEESTRSGAAPAFQNVSSELSCEPVRNTNWVKGKILSMPGYTFHAKVFDLPSSYGIDDGRISKLQVLKHGQEVVNYERGWDQKPDTPEQVEAVHRIRRGLGDMPEKEFQAYQHMPDKGHGFER